MTPTDLLETFIMRKSMIPVMLVLASTVPLSVDAYEMTNAVHTGTTHTLYVNPDVSASMPDHFDVLEIAESKLNANASALRFSLVNDNDNFSTLGNGESEVDFTSNNTKLCGSIACVTRWSSGGVLTETDAYFDIDYAWALDDAKANSVAYATGEKRPLLNTAMHEFSHTLGVKHEGDYFQVMGNAWNVVSTNGDYTETVLSEDTTKGLIDTYGLRASGLEDLSVYHWEHAGSTNGYSNHARTPIKNSNGTLKTEVAGSTVPDEPAYEVTAGETIRVRQTAENRGKTTQNRKIRWYVSTNEFISSGDTLIATSNITLGVNTPYTWDRTVTLPNTLISGEEYWVGVIIDADDTLAESNEINNAAYIAELQVQ